MRSHTSRFYAIYIPRFHHTVAVRRLPHAHTTAATQPSPHPPNNTYCGRRTARKQQKRPTVIRKRNSPKNKFRPHCAKKEGLHGRPFVFFPYLCTRKCACGGTGRRARLRIWFLAKCRFESCQAHTQKLRNAGHRTNRTSPGPHDV